MLKSSCSIIPSSSGTVSPFRFNSTTRAAHRWLIVASHGSNRAVQPQFRTIARADLALRPRGCARMPIRSSPIIIESTIKLDSFALSHVTTLLSACCFVGTKHVRIDEVNHPSLGSLISSVVSVRSSGWNQSFTGQESNSFTSPLFRGFVVRLRRYSLRSIRSISNSCPDLMSSSRRISTARTICPFVETVVLVTGKIMSYQDQVNEIRPPITAAVNY